METTTQQDKIVVQFTSVLTHQEYLTRANGYLQQMEECNDRLRKNTGAYDALIDDYRRAVLRVSVPLCLALVILTLWKNVLDYALVWWSCQVVLEMVFYSRRRKISNVAESNHKEFMQVAAQLDALKKDFREQELLRSCHSCMN